MEKYKIIVAGTGMIGAGLAANAILNGQEVTLYDVIPEEKIRVNIMNVMEILIEAEAATREAVDEKMRSVQICTDLNDALESGADMIQESVPERLDIKQSIYKTVQEKLGRDVIIASSTSMMFPSALSEGMLYPEQIVVGHPYNPSYLLPLIEVCGGETASEETVNKALDIYTAMGKAPVVCKKEVNGFIVNNISWQAFSGAAEAVKTGICTAEDVDKAIMFGPGMRMAVLGQLLTISLGIEGGLAKAPEKYGLPADDLYDLLGAGVDEEIANRKESQGRNIEDIIKWRDKAFAALLKIHEML